MDVNLRKKSIINLRNINVQPTKNNLCIYIYIYEHTAVFYDGAMNYDE